ncbi:hypothetical protein Dimus_031478 [Dionaea muscipula]
MEKQRSFFAPGQMRRIYASKCAGDLSQRNSSCNRPDSLDCTNYDRVARSCTDEELMDLVEFERRGSIYSADSIHHAPYEVNKKYKTDRAQTYDGSSRELNDTLDSGDVEAAVMAKDSFSTGNGRQPMPRFDVSSDYHNITRNTTTGGQNLMTPHGVDGDEFSNSTLVAHAAIRRGSIYSADSMHHAPYEVNKKYKTHRAQTYGGSSCELNDTLDSGDVEVGVMAKDSFSTGNGRKLMPRFDVSSDYHNIITRNTTGGQNLTTPHGVDGDDEFSNSTLVAHAATGRNGIANGSATIDVMIDTQNDLSANGFIVRDGNIRLVRIKSFKEISPMDQDHMWAMDSFKNDNFELHRKYVFHHMKKLWDNWRGELKQYIKKKCGNDKALALERGHKDFEQEDWAWLIENHFFTDKFLKKSEQNCRNRAKLEDGLLHRTGSKPFRVISWEMGGKDGNPPSLETMYFETRKTKNKTLEEAAARKYDQITEVRRSQPSISTIDLIETCFKPQKGHVICFGGAVKPKDLRSSQPSRAELMTKFQQQRDEDATTFTNRIDEPI